jgi:hypothetical protein
MPKKIIYYFYLNISGVEKQYSMKRKTNRKTERTEKEREENTA